MQGTRLVLVLRRSRQCLNPVLEPCFKGKRKELTLPYNDWIITSLFVLTPWTKEIEPFQGQSRFAA
jgi:hypothetical protein